MRQLKANRVDGPFGTAYIVEKEKGTNMYWKKEEFLKDYSVRLLEILDKEGEYISPKQDPNQLKLFIINN